MYTQTFPKLIQILKEATAVLAQLVYAAARHAIIKPEQSCIKR